MNSIKWRLPASPPLASHSLGYGRITYEARATEGILSVLDLAEEAYCFAEVPDYREKYRKGNILAINDTDTMLALKPCLLKLLHRAQVRAKLVVPIVVQQELWGLLIAHQCFVPRPWQEQEQSFLLRIAEHLAIAIYQANLYGQLQEQKHTLAQRVEERTQELCDALKAAQAANLTKSEFLATMSHELRTPLTSIIGMTTTLLRLKSGLNKDQIVSPERQQNYLQTIQRSGESLLQLINDILDLSEVEAGKTVLEIQPFSLSQLATESIRPLRDKARQNSISLELELQLELQSSATELSNSDTFTADPQRIQQILQNLLSNAIKFTPTGGSVTLRIWREQETAVFQVEDTGIGIPDNQRSLLFTKFQQLDMSHHRAYEGIGVGLALTKQLVELHRGRIEVESTVNAGSTFTVWIPKQTGNTKKARPSNKNESLQFSQGRILLIEDDEEIATLICDLLTTAGYQVIWIEDGMTAIQQVTILNPLVAIVSTHLADANAQEILLQIKDNPITTNIRILVLSYDPSPETNATWLELGAHECLTMSDFQPESLLNQVAAIAQA